MLAFIAPLFAVATIGRTFGNGLAGLSVCQGNAGEGPVDTVLLNYTLSGDTGVDHGVLTHFWVTGDAPAIDEVWVSYFVDGLSDRYRLEPPGTPLPGLGP